MNHILKIHIAYGIFFTIISAVVLFLGFLTAVSFYLGIIEGLLIGDVLFLGGAVFMGSMYGFAMVLVGYQVLYLFIRMYLDERTLKVPNECPNCEENLDTDNVKWIEEEKRAECPHCGVELIVTRKWTEDSF